VAVWLNYVVFVRAINRQLIAKIAKQTPMLLAKAEITFKCSSRQSVLNSVI
jgi:hypothetical protein